MKDSLDSNKDIKNVYDFEIDKVLKAVKESAAKSVLLQFPH